MASQAEELFKRVDTVLKAASAAERVVGDGGARPDEAIRLYTEAVQLLNGARSTGGYSAQLTASMEKKAEEIQARIQIIRRRAQAIGDRKLERAPGAAAHESSAPDPFKASVAVLHSAVEADAKFKARDRSQGPTAIKMYTEGLRLLDQALGSGSYNHQVQALLKQKEREVRARLDILEPLVTAVDAADVVDAGVPPAKTTVTEQAAQTTPSDEAVKIERLQSEVEQLQEELQTSRERNQRALDAEQAHASEMNATKRQFDENLAAKQAAHEKALQTLSARSDTELAAAKTEIDALQTQLAEQTSQARAALDRCALDAEQAHASEMNATKRQFDENLAAKQAAHEKALQTLSARSDTELAAAKTEIDALQTQLAEQTSQARAALDRCALDAEQAHASEMNATKRQFDENLAAKQAAHEKALQTLSARSDTELAAAKTEIDALQTQLAEQTSQARAALDRCALDAEQAHASEMNATKRQFDENLAAKQAAHEKALQTLSARSDTELAAAKTEIDALQTQLAEQTSQARAALDRCALDAEQAHASEMNATKRQFDENLAAKQAAHEKALQTLSARSDTELAAAKTEVDALQTQLAEQTSQARVALQDTEATMIARILDSMQKQRQGRSVAKSIHGWNQLVVRKVTLRKRMERAALRIRLLALQSIFSQWTRLTLKQRRRRGLRLLVVQRLQYRHARVVFDAWAVLVSHDTAQRRRTDQLQMLHADLQHCEMLMDQRVLVLATQKLKIRSVTRAIDMWRKFAFQRVRTQAKLQNSVRHLLKLRLSRSLLSWQMLARRTAHMRGIGDKVATRMQNTSTAKSFYVIRAYAKQTKRIRKMMLKWRRCLVKEAFSAWANLAAYEVEQRRCKEALQAAVALRLHESELTSEVMQQRVEASVAEVEDLEAQCSQAAKAASEATADVEKLQKEVDAFASTRDALTKKDERVRGLESMVNALREEAVAALPARLNAILVAAQHLAEAKLQQVEAENLATKMTELTHLKDTLTGRIIEHQATAERGDDMVTSASMPALTGVFQSIDEEGSISALEHELDATAKEIQLLENRMSDIARSLSDDNKYSVPGATSLLAGSATPMDGGEPEVATVYVGSDDHGALGIEFKPVSIRALSQDGICQHRASHPLEAGMVLHTVNGIPAERLAYNALLEMTDAYDGNRGGLTLTFKRDRPHRILASVVSVDTPRSGSSGEVHSAIAAEVRAADVAHMNAVVEAITAATSTVHRACSAEVAKAKVEKQQLQSTIQALYQEHKRVVLGQRQAIQDAEREIMESTEEDYQVREKERQTEHRVHIFSLEKKVARLERQAEETRSLQLPEEIERQHRAAIQKCEEAIAACKSSEEITETSSIEIETRMMRAELEQQAASQQEQQARFALHEERIRNAETLDAMKASWARKLQDVQSEHMKELTAKVQEARKAALELCDHESRQMEHRLDAERPAAIQNGEQAIATCEVQEEEREDDLQTAVRKLTKMQSTQEQLESELENERNLRKYTEGLLREEQDARAELLSNDAAFMESLSHMQGGVLEELDSRAFDAELNELMKLKAEAQTSAALALDYATENARLKDELANRGSYGDISADRETALVQEVGESFVVGHKNDNYDDITVAATAAASAAALQVNELELSRVSEELERFKSLHSSSEKDAQELRAKLADAHCAAQKLPLQSEAGGRRFEGITCNGEEGDLLVGVFGIQLWNATEILWSLRYPEIVSWIHNAHEHSVEILTKPLNQQTRGAPWTAGSIQLEMPQRQGAEVVEEMAAASAALIRAAAIEEGDTAAMWRDAQASLPAVTMRAAAAADHILNEFDSLDLDAMEAALIGGENKIDAISAVTTTLESTAAEVEGFLSPPCSGQLKVDVVWCTHALPADKSGKSDVFVVVWLGNSREQKTKVKSRTLAPQLNETFELALDLPSANTQMDAESQSLTLSVEVWDSDRSSSDNFLGQTTLALGQEFAKAGGWIDREVTESFALSDLESRVGVKTTQGQELVGRYAAGDERPHGSIELRLSFSPGNAAAVSVDDKSWLIAGNEVEHIAGLEDVGTMNPAVDTDEDGESSANSE